MEQWPLCGEEAKKSMSWLREHTRGDSMEGKLGEEAEEEEEPRR